MNRPLLEFNEIVEALTRSYREQVSAEFSPADEAKISAKLSQLYEEFERLYAELVGETAVSYERDESGAVIMSDQGANVVAEPTDREGERPTVLDEDSAGYRRVRGLLRDMPSVEGLLRRQTVLTTDLPTNVPPDLVPSTSHQLSELLYLRNQAWLSTFSGTTPTDAYATLRRMDEPMRQLWWAYERQVLPLPPREHVETALPDYEEEDDDDDETRDSKNKQKEQPSAPMNSFDALFAPFRVLDYSPSELVLAVQTQRLVRFYYDLANAQVRQIRKQLVSALNERRREQAIGEELTMRLDRLHRQRVVLVEQVNEARKWSQESLAIATAELSAVDSEERQAAEALSRLIQAREDREGLSQGAAYRRFLMTRYIGREIMFLQHLNDVLVARRDHRQLLGRMKEARAFASTDRLLDKTVTRQYLRERDRLLARIYELDYPRGASASSTPPTT